MEKHFYGIDISKDSLQIAYQNSFNQWQDTIISNEIDSIEKWLSLLDLKITHLVYEYTGTYALRLTYCLELLGANFSIITPKQSKGFSQSLKNTSKTDKSDARMLCVYGQKHQPENTAILSESLHQKRQKFNYLITLKSEKQSFENRLHALSYDPKSAIIIVNSIKKIILTLESEIKAIQQEVFTISDDENTKLQTLMTSVVGIGVVSANALIIATNGLKDFENRMW